MTATDIEGESGKYYADGRAVEPSVAARVQQMLSSG
jgi:hypothetical protein